MGKTVVGIDLGGTNLKAAVVGPDRRVLARLSLPTEETRGPEHVIGRMVSAAWEVAAQGDVAWSDVAAVGVGAPGLLDWKSGFVHSLTNMTGWTDIALGDALGARFEGLPCFVENDATAACYGEYWLGAGRGTQTMCMLTLGTGVGGGMVIGGALHRGIDGTAAELGHMIVQRDGRLCGCGARGCLEAYASVTGMVRTAREGLEGGADSALREAVNGDLDAITGVMISECAEAGDAFATEVIADTGRWLGVGIAGLLAILNPECVALAGGMTAAGDALLEAITDTVAESALDVPASRARIVYSELGEDAGVLGAAGCALLRSE